MKKLIIGAKSYSSWSLRPWHNLKVNGVDFEEQLIPFAQHPDRFDLDRDTKEAIRKLSPSGKVPCLITGERTITESLAIMLSQWGQTDMADPRIIGAISLASELVSGFGFVRTDLPYCAIDSVENSVEIGWLPAATQKEVLRLYDIATSLAETDHRSIVTSMIVPYLMRFETYRLVPPNAAAAKACEAILDCPFLKEWRAAAQKEARTVPLLHEYIGGFNRKFAPT